MKKLSKSEKIRRHKKTKSYLERTNRRNHKSEIKRRMKESREKVIERDGHECQICKSLGMSEKLNGHNCQVHHILPKTFCKKEFEYLLYDTNNLILLCYRHHHICPKLSPHMNAIAFTEFLKENRPGLYDYALAYINFPVTVPLQIQNEYK